MSAFRRLLWLIPFLWVGVALAQDEGGKDAKKDDAEVQFANGSTVRMAILQDKIDVLTRYGKLSVPLAEVQRIEFGVHLPPDVAKQVDAALAKLGSVQYAEREEATRDLTALGPSSYCALLRAVKSTDMEVARRAEKILVDIRGRFSDKELRSREDDIVATAHFTIVGRIVTPALKGQSDYFGSVQLRLPQMRQLRLIHTPGETQLAVDAAQYGSAYGQWLDTGMNVEERTNLVIVASGSIDIYPQTPGQYLSTPKGYGNITLSPGARVTPTQVNLRSFSGALFGRIGDSGDAFYIGERYEGAAGREGKLYLHIVPSPWNNASAGSYQVKVTPRN